MNKHLWNALLFSILGMALNSCASIESIDLVNSGEVVSQNTLDSIVPFTHEGHPILVQARINHSPKEYTFILDTGALTMIRKEVAEELNLANGIEVKAHGSGGNTNRINLVKLDSVILGNKEVRNSATGITDFQPLFPKKIAGILGSNVLKHFKVTINFQKKELQLSSNTSPVAPMDEDIKIPVDLDMFHGFAPVVEFMIDDEFTNKGIIDTGFPGFFSIPVSIIKKSPSLTNGSLITSNGSMSGGMFGMSNEKSYGLRLNRVNIGNLQLQDILAFSHPDERGLILIGNKFLEKYSVILNYPAKEMILRPLGRGFDSNKSDFGLALTKKEHHTIVSGVWQNSSASEKGLKPGDRIIKIDSIETNSISSVYELMIMLMDNKKEHITIEFINSLGKQKAVLDRKPLFPDLK